MGDQEDSLFILAVGQFQQGDDLLRILPVKVPCRLVRQQDRGLVDQGAPDCRPPAVLFVYNCSNCTCSDCPDK